MPDLKGKKVAWLGYAGIIDSAGVTRIAQNLNGAVNQKFDCAYLCLSSQGGYVADGVYLYNHIRALPIPVIIHNTGTIASIATTLFSAGEHRLSSKTGIFMMHPIAAGVASQSLASAPLLAALESAKADEERTEAILRERTKIPDDILTARRQGDVFMTAEQALGYGLVHEIGEFALPAGEQIFQI